MGIRRNISNVGEKKSKFNVLYLLLIVLLPAAALAGAVAVITVSVSLRVVDFRISPPSGAYITTQNFDLTLIVEESPGISVTGFDSAVIDDGVSPTNFTNLLATSAIPGALTEGGESFRLRNLGDKLSAVLGPGFYTMDITLDLSDGSQVSASVIWDVLPNAGGGPAAGLTMSPPFGSYVTTQDFDLVHIVGVSEGVSVVGFSNATIDDGITLRDITNLLAANSTSGTLTGGGETFLLPRTGRRLSNALGAGIYTLDVTLDLSDASQVTSSVTWEVLQNAE